MDGPRSQRKGNHISRRLVFYDAFALRLLLVHKECGQEAGIMGRKPGETRSWAGSGQRCRAGDQRVLEDARTPGTGTESKHGHSSRLCSDSSLETPARW